MTGSYIPKQNKTNVLFQHVSACFSMFQQAAAWVGKAWRAFGPRSSLHPAPRKWSANGSQFQTFPNKFGPCWAALDQFDFWRTALVTSPASRWGLHWSIWPWHFAGHPVSILLASCQPQGGAATAAMTGPKRWPRSHLKGLSVTSHTNIHRIYMLAS